MDRKDSQLRVELQAELKKVIPEINNIIPLSVENHESVT